MVTPPRPGSLASRLGRTSTVLVVEDEPDIATFLGAFFRASGTEIRHVNPTTVSEVTELAAGIEAACLLLDLSLDGLSGFEILEAFRDDPRLSATPVVIVTADSRPATRERAVGLGAAAFVPKPFNVKDLFATVRALVEGDPLLATESSDAPTKAARVRRGALRGGLLPPEILQRRLAVALEEARPGAVPVAFALLRVLGAGGGQPAVMAEVATVLAAALADAEVLGSTAPDELAVLFTGETAAAAVLALTDAMGDGHLELTLPAGRSMSVRCAAGVAAAPEHAGTGDELYMAADAALADAVDTGLLLTVAR